MKVPSIDLHGKSYYEAEQLLIRFIESHLFTDNEIEIITGNSNRMKDVVFKILDEYALDYVIGRTGDVYNKGYVVVKLDYKED